MTYKIPNITVDAVLFEDDSILLVQRKNQPFKGKWALPGGFVEYGEKTEDAVTREMVEETGLQTKVSALVGVYSDPNRDPRGHTITIVYSVQRCGGTLQSGDDAAAVKFYRVNKLPQLSFDHDIIIKDTIQRFVK